MSWDIYGNPLRRGYCEVHPDVHQEYPCSICMAQKQQQSQPHNELEQLQYEFAQQGDYIRHLESERAALATQVDSLLDDRKESVKKEFQLLKEIERLEIELKKRDEQNAALAAQVDALKDAINKCTVDGVALLRLSPELKQVVAATPQHHLRKVRAEAVLDAVNFGRNQTKYFLRSSEDILQQIEQYAESIRQGGAA